MDRVEEFIFSGSQSYNCYDLVRDFHNECKYLDINLFDERIEIPDFMLCSLSRSLIRNIGRVTYCLSPSTCGAPRERKLVRGALSDFMQGFLRRRIQTVVMGNGKTYYGLPGVIFDSDFNILLIMTTTIRIPDLQTLTTFHVTNHICRISPVIFQDQGVIEKAIIKKVIPYCAMHNTSSRDYPTLPVTVISGILEKPIQVIIGDVNSLFIREIVPPKVSDKLDERVHDILYKNMDQIIK